MSVAPSSSATRPSVSSWTEEGRKKKAPKKEAEGEAAEGEEEKKPAKSIIFLGEEVNDTTASLVVAQILYLEAQGPRQGYPALYQLARRQRDRRHGDL